MLYSIVGLLVIIIDQAVKFWVTNTLFGNDVVKFIPGVISLVNTHNKGAAFSFLSGSDARIYFIIVTGVFVLLVIIALATNFISGRFSRWCLVLVAAGGLGNMIDRVIYGYVVDMFKVELFNFAIFNVADVFITVFAILFALAMIFEKPQDDIDEDFAEDDEEVLAPDEPAPARKSPFAKKEKAEKPAKKDSSVGSARKARQDKYEKEYQEYKEQQRAAMRKAAAESAAPAKDERPAALDGPAPKAAPAPAPASKPQPKRTEAPAGGDPFAAWERANAKVEAEQGYAGSLMRAQPKRREAPKPAPAESAAPAKQAAPAPKPVEQPKPQPKPEPAAPKAEEFSLDDILAEFK